MTVSHHAVRQVSRPWETTGLNSDSLLGSGFHLWRRQGVKRWAGLHVGGAANNSLVCPESCRLLAAGSPVVVTVQPADRQAAT